MQLGHTREPKSTTTPLLTTPLIGICVFCSITTVLIGGGWWWSRALATGPFRLQRPLSYDADDTMTARATSTSGVVQRALFAEQGAAQLRPPGETSQESKLVLVQQPTQATPHSAELCLSDATDIRSFECPATDALHKSLATFNASRTKLQRLARERG